MLRFLDLGPSLLCVIAGDGLTEKHKYAYRELKFKLVDQQTVALDRGNAGMYMCVVAQCGGGVDDGVGKGVCVACVHVRACVCVFGRDSMACM